MRIADAHGWSDDPVSLPAWPRGRWPCCGSGGSTRPSGGSSGRGARLQPEGEPGTELIVHHARGLCAWRRAGSTRRWRPSAPPNGCKRCWPTASIRPADAGAPAADAGTHGPAGGCARGARRHQRGRAQHLRHAHRRRRHSSRRGEPEQAVEVLAPVIDVAPTAHRSSVTTEAQVLDAVAREQLGDQRAAEASLERALELAEPEGIVLPFILAPVQDLLERLPRHRTGTPRCAKPSSTSSPVPRRDPAERPRSCSRSSARLSCASFATCPATSGRRRSLPSCSSRRTRSGRICATSTPSSTPTAAPRRSPAPGSLDCLPRRGGSARGHRQRVSRFESSVLRDDGSPGRTPACSGRRDKPKVP